MRFFLPEIVLEPVEEEVQSALVKICAMVRSLFDDCVWFAARPLRLERTQPLAPSTPPSGAALAVQPSLEQLIEQTSTQISFLIQSAYSYLY